MSVFNIPRENAKVITCVRQYSWLLKYFSGGLALGRFLEWLILADIVIWIFKSLTGSYVPEEGRLACDFVSLNRMDVTWNNRYISNAWSKVCYGSNLILVRQKRWNWALLDWGFINWLIAPQLLVVPGYPKVFRHLHPPALAREHLVWTGALKFKTYCVVDSIVCAGGLAEQIVFLSKMFIY